MSSDNLRKLGKQRRGSFLLKCNVVLNGYAFSPEMSEKDNT